MPSTQLMRHVKGIFLVNIQQKEENKKKMEWKK